MSEVLQNLDKNLKQQVTLYEELYDLEQSKQKALLENNIPEIETITAFQEQLLLAASHLEKKRIVLAEQIWQGLEKAPEDITLAELADHFPVLQEVRGDLEQVVGSLQKIHGINSQLLQQAMKIVEFTMGMITHQESNTYAHPSRREYGNKGILHLLDRRI